MSAPASKAPPAKSKRLPRATLRGESGSDEPAVHTIGLVLACLLGAVALNLHHTAIWCAPLALGAAAWRARSGRSRPRLPGRALRLVIVVILSLAALADFHSNGSLGAAASLLVVMAALKLSETTQRRDWLIVLSAAVFLLLAACLDAQALWRLPLYATEVWLLCTALYALGAGRDAPPPTVLMASAARSLFAALPLAVLLFLLFPRLPGAFWAYPDPKDAVTGLGDEMDPGSITHLENSSDPAMRVRFDGPLPPLRERYWRGPVLHDFDGFTWRRHPNNLGSPPPLQFSGTPYHYDITLEPNERRVMLALEMPQSGPTGLPTYWTYDYQLLAPLPIMRSVNYALVSYPQHRNLRPLSAAERRVDLQLPRRRNPRTLALAQQLHSAAAGDRAYMTAVLDYLRRGHFSYTVDPPALGRDSVDDLLFRTRQGFCEHYASAFTTLMRAGGVPARVVTGYLGGEWNRFGNYLLVRQSSAHAWSEVWLDGSGWVRVDPTSVISPASLSQQLEGLEPENSASARLEGAPWILGTVQAWQAMNAWWTDRFVGFNFARQLSMLSLLGLRSQAWRALVWLLGLGAALWLAIIGWSQRARLADRNTDALGRAWRQLERKLAHCVGARAAHEGPMAYADRIGKVRPELAQSVRALARRYARLRYGPRASRLELQQFRRAVQVWRPRPARMAQR